MFPLVINLSGDGLCNGDKEQMRIVKKSPELQHKLIMKISPVRPRVLTVRGGQTVEIQ